MFSVSFLDLDATANPSIVSIVLASIIIFSTPIISTLLSRRFTVKAIFVSTALLAASAVLLLLCFQGRTALLMLAFSYVVIVFRSMSATKRTTYISSVCIAAVVLFALYYKPNSTAGRILVYTVIFKELTNPGFPFLTGVGSFSAWYNHAQARYFSSHPIDSKEALLADNTYFAFNDYIQFCIEHGIIAFVVLMSLLVFYLRAAIRFLRNKNHNNLILAAHLCITSLLLAALFSYPFHVWYTYPVIVIASLVIFRQAKPLQRLWRVQSVRTALKVSGVLVIVFGVVRIGKEYDYYKAQKEADSLAQSGFVQKSCAMYKELIDRGARNGKLFYNYATVLFAANKIDSALMSLDVASKYFFSDGTALLKGQLLMQKNDSTAAETYFKEAVFINPKSFRNRLQLINFYNAVRNFAEARRWSELTLNLHEKVPSSRTREIKEYLRNELFKGHK